MSAPDIDQNVMSSFSLLGSDAHLTLLLGAGASAPSGLPDWDTFAQRVAMRSGLISSENAARILLDKQDHTIVLEAARVHAGDQWESILHEALFDPLGEDPRPSPLHSAAANHFLESPSNTTLSTLNYDTLLEHALDHGQARVHHLHGKISNGTAHQPIVGFRDYANLVANEQAWQRQFLSDALSRGPLLLAGTSYRDPDIRHWLQSILLEEKPPHAALVTIVREGLGLDRESFAAIESALVAEWQAIGLTALPMHDLVDVALVVRELLFVGREDYRPPQERARDVWTSHARRFDRLQVEYGQALVDDGKHLSRSLGLSTQSATLWLANGRGQLVRWASEGSQYRGIKQLKRVPTGHDSPWIAGEAIGTEQVKIKDVQRDPRISPKWRSVVAIPIFTSDHRHPDFATGALTFGMAKSASSVLQHRDEIIDASYLFNETWGTRLSSVAFTTSHG